VLGLVAAVGNAREFKSGRELSAWRREEEFLAEARTLAKFFWKGFDSMMTV
jgi:hypothetical protein